MTHISSGTSIAVAIAALLIFVIGYAAIGGFVVAAWNAMCNGNCKNHLHPDRDAQSLFWWPLLAIVCIGLLCQLVGTWVYHEVEGMLQVTGHKKDQGAQQRSIEW